MYIFSPEEHTYQKEGLNDKTISVSGIISLYHEKYDKDYWSLYKAWSRALFPNISDPIIEKAEFRKVRKAIKFSKLKDYTLFSKLEAEYPHHIQSIPQLQKDILKEWQIKNKKSTDRGSEYHDNKEKEVLTKGWDINPFTKTKLESFQLFDWKEGKKIQPEDLSNLKNGVYPEIIVYYDGIFGQIDRLIVEDNKLYILDYKTNESIDFRNPFQKMFHPVNHLDDCNYYHYCLQLNLYMYILLQYGYEYGACLINHADLSKETPVETDIEVPNLQKEVENLIIDYNLKI